MMSLTSQRLPACLLGSSGSGKLRCRDLQFLRKAGCPIPHCRSPKNRDSLGKPGHPFDAYLTGIAFSISISIGLTLFGCRGARVFFFRQDGLKAGIAVSSLNFALTPFSVVISALFRRDLEFGKLAVCSLAANFVSIAVSIALAVLRYSFMAPIWGA